MKNSPKVSISFKMPRDLVGLSLHINKKNCLQERIIWWVI